MEASDREETELELAAAILLLWVLFSDIRQVGPAAYELFMEGFNRLVRPIVTRIYGRARATIAQVYGYEYPSRPAATGDGQVVMIPGLQRRVDQYARDLYDTFLRRQAADQERRAAGEEPPEFAPRDAGRISVTETTRIHSEGEMDGSRDVESRTGMRLVAIWRTEPGACPICSPLEGTIRQWQQVFPGGPPGHPNCRCHLEWRQFLG